MLERYQIAICMDNHAKKVLCLKLVHSFRSFGSESNQVGNRIMQTIGSLKLQETNRGL